MAKYIKIKRPGDEGFLSGWGFVAICAIALTIAVFISRGGLETIGAGLSNPSGCRVEVAVDSLNVRSEPNSAAPIVQSLTQGDLQPATDVVQNGFRQLSQSRWAWATYLTTVPGSTCT